MKEKQNINDQIITDYSGFKRMTFIPGENSVDDLAVAMMVIDTKLNKLIELLGPMAKYVEDKRNGTLTI